MEKILPEELNENIFKLIGEDWMLITGGKPDRYNTMTASWGTMGILWHKKVAMCFIRPQRYTFDFVNENEFFTLSFFYEQHRDILNYCGKESGRNVDKVKETGLIPFTTDNEAVGFKQARLVVECRKIYYDDFDPGKFLIGDINKKYTKDDYHRIFIGEISNIYRQG